MSYSTTLQDDPALAEHSRAIREAREAPDSLVIPAAGVADSAGWSREWAIAQAAERRRMVVRLSMPYMEQLRLMGLAVISEGAGG